MKIEIVNFDVKTSDGWNNFLDDIARSVRGMAIEEELQLSELVLMVNRDPLTLEAYERPRALYVLTIFTDHAPSKDLFAMHGRSLSLCGDAVASCFIAEAWSSTYGSDREYNEATAPMPRDDPRREEMLVMFTEHRDFGMHGRRAKIHPGGPPRSIEDWQTYPFDNTKGRFASWLVPNAMRTSPRYQDILDASQSFLRLSQDMGNIAIKRVEGEKS